MQASVVEVGCSWSPTSARLRCCETCAGPSFFFQLTYKLYGYQHSVTAGVRVCYSVEHRCSPQTPLQPTPGVASWPSDSLVRAARGNAARQLPGTVRPCSTECPASLPTRAPTEVAGRYTG